MVTEVKDNQEVCEACGCAGEIGFIIQEGDEVALLEINAADKASLEAEFSKYLELAKQVTSDVEYDVQPMSEDATLLTARFKFTCSAEKLIFELKTRTLGR
ncbi:YfcZ/YiiS family protein [Vibrio tapetis]|uniref:DUF406 family protein n=1 Tax=Vibrio tapetis subsp. tapetis TaxID=1671868 RepID=A0A2N8ZMQ0_9VIBR|nr:YfcZ/YiiS family protein [Vibrio tapetis]SON53193.1 conserved protein of unknown function [Vibrio tapetis subsp. tapetis]